MKEFTAQDLKSIKLFSNLTIDQCDQLLYRHILSKYEISQQFIMEQDWDESIFIICSGISKVRRYTSDGDEVIMSVLGIGDVFGEMSLIKNCSRSADVVALTSGSVLKLRLEPIKQLLKRQPIFSFELFKLEASRLRDLNQRFAIQSSNATVRLLNTLAYLACKSSIQSSPTSLIPSLSQFELGLISNLSRETTSRTLTKLIARGIIQEENKRLKIVDLNYLNKQGLYFEESSC